MIESVLKWSATKRLFQIYLNLNFRFFSWWNWSRLVYWKQWLSLTLSLRYKSWHVINFWKASLSSRFQTGPCLTGVINLWKASLHVRMQLDIGFMIEDYKSVEKKTQRWLNKRCRFLNSPFEGLSIYCNTVLV